MSCVAAHESTPAEGHIGVIVWWWREKLAENGSVPGNVVVSPGGPEEDNALPPDGTRNKMSPFISTYFKSINLFRM